MCHVVANSEAQGPFMTATRMSPHYRWSLTPTRLVKMYKKMSNMCWKCKDNEGTFYHMWWTCKLAKALCEMIYNELQKYLK